MSVIKKFPAILCLAALLGHGHAMAAGQSEQPLDGVVVVVNDDVITRHELDDRVADVVRRLKRQGTPLPDRMVLEKQLLESMISDLLISQFAKENGVRVDDDQLDKEMQDLAGKNKFATTAQFRAALEKQGEDYKKFRESVRAQMVSNMLREREIASKLVITDSEVNNFIAAEEGRPGNDQEYHVARIAVVIPEQASAERVQASRAKASAALALLKKGANFAQVSAGYSDADNALNGGDMGWRPGDQFPGPLREVLEKMQPGEISPLLHSPNAYYILKLIERRKRNETVIITQTHVRHILVKTSDLVSDSEAKARIMEIKKEIEGGAGFAEEAKLHSDDGSAAQGGDLGWVSPGETVPPFEKAMNNLQPGEMSGPVHTAFGWHLIQVLDRRNKDVSDVEKRVRAHYALQAIKLDEGWQDWQRQLRDSAHIEYLGEFAAK